MTRFEGFYVAADDWRSFRDGRLLTEPEPEPPPPDPDPPPLTGQVIGINTTDTRLAEWKRRSESGPYRVFNDVGSNSPGDWDRITAYATAFSTSMPYWHYNLDPHTGGNDSGFVTAMRARDAAFSALVESNLTLGNQVMTWMVGQANNFSWLARPPATEPESNFTHMEWLATYVFAYDYLRTAGVGTTQQRATVEQWMKDGCTWRIDPHWSEGDTGSWYQGTWVGDRYDLVPSEVHGTTDELAINRTHVTGHQTSVSGRSMNNRRLSIMSVGAYVGLLTGELKWVNWTKQWIKEWLVVGAYPDLDAAEYQRGMQDETNSEVGWAYMGSKMRMLFLVMDALAIRGDMELVNWATEVGIAGTEGSPAKTLLAQAIGYARYGNDGHSPHRYGGTNTTAGDIAMRMDGRQDRNGSQFRYVSDVTLGLANIWFNNAELKAAYLRNTAQGHVPYWTNPSSVGPRAGEVQYMGGNGGVPGMLFMFGQMEDSL